jgi:predicted DNA-binding transcriptional regulator YafY
MATNKHAQIRYIALDNCFSNYGRKYYIEDLVAACNTAIYDFTGKHEGVKKRQIYEDIKFMESGQGWQIELDRVKDGKKIYHRYLDKNYSINKSPLNQVEVTQISEVLLTLSRFKGMPQFEWIDEITSRLQSISGLNVNKIIDFEQNQFLKGIELITPLFNAIYNKRVLKISYLPFKGEKGIVYTLHPYYLKQYNLRWFLFGLNEQSNQISNLALDRILKLNEVSTEYRENADIDFNEYFDDIIGVSVISTKPIEKITLLISNDLWPYIKTKPIHGSQKPPQFTNDGILIELRLIVNYELVATLLSHGNGLKVLSPESLVKEMKNKAQQILNNYF